MNPAVGCDDFRLVDGCGIPAVIGDEPACFGNKQGPGGAIPGIQLGFPEPVDPACGHVAQIESGGTGAPDALAPQGKCAEIIQIIPVMAELVN